MNGIPGHSTGTGQPMLILETRDDGYMSVWAQWDNKVFRRMGGTVTRCEDPAHGQGKIVLNTRHTPA